MQKQKVKEINLLENVNNVVDEDFVKNNREDFSYQS